MDLWRSQQYSIPLSCRSQTPKRRTQRRSRDGRTLPHHEEPQSRGSPPRRIQSETGEREHPACSPSCTSRGRSNISLSVVGVYPACCGGVRPFAAERRGSCERHPAWSQRCCRRSSCQSGRTLGAPWIGFGKPWRSSPWMARYCRFCRTSPGQSRGLQGRPSRLADRARAERLDRYAGAGPLRLAHTVQVVNHPTPHREGHQSASLSDIESVSHSLATDERTSRTFQNSREDCER